MTDDPTSDLDQALAACASEPIRYSGAIQPHGYLISCDSHTGLVRHVSGNCAELFESEPDALLGRPIEELLQLPLPLLGTHADAQAASTRTVAYAGSVNVGPQARFCDVSLHTAQGLLHLEIEPQRRQPDTRAPADLVHDAIARIGADALPIHGLHRQVADDARALTGFDRVMIYRFLDDDTGEVIAESLAEGVQSYLGLRYPASDIPPQARALYLRSRVRVIPDTAYMPAPILPPLHADGSALDLSLHALRSVSPVHLEYMRNMGMAASMSISIVVDGRLWGLIVCHHRSPRRLPPRHRIAADLLGMFYAMRLASLQHLHQAQRQTRSHVLRNAIVRMLGADQAASHIVSSVLPDLRDLLQADAAVHVHPQGQEYDGEPVEAATVAAARRWCDAHPEPVAATDTAADWSDGAGTFAGVLGLRLSAGHTLMVLRREQVEQVNWAGKPDKQLVSTDDGVRLAPRRSFRTWSEKVRGRSAPWQRDQLDDAEAIAVLLGHALRQAERTPSTPAVD